MKFNKNDYKFIDLTETAFEDFSAVELDRYIADTMEVLGMTKGKMTKTMMNLSLAAGLLTVRGGEFVRINAFVAKYNKGNLSKEELKVVKKVMSTAKWYYRLKVILALISQNNSFDEIKPMLAEKNR